MGMEGCDFYKSRRLAGLADANSGLVRYGCEGPPYVELGPFDILAWQLLWVVGLFFGQRFHGGAPVLHMPGPVEGVLLILAIGFLGWRWESIYRGLDLSNHMWLLDKWHLGPLRLINFFIADWLIAKFLKRLERLETPLRPLSIIGQHMLPIFCCQTCLSILLIGLVDPLRDSEPLTSVLVICQLFSAFLLAWFFEWRSQIKISTPPQGRAFPVRRKILTVVS
jgi:hypothetical protein